MESSERDNSGRYMGDAYVQGRISGAIVSAFLILLFFFFSTLGNMLGGLTDLEEEVEEEEDMTGGHFSELERNQRALVLICMYWWYKYEVRRGDLLLRFEAKLRKLRRRRRTLYFFALFVFLFCLSLPLLLMVYPPAGSSRGCAFQVWSVGGREGRN